MRIQHLNHSTYQHQYHIIWGTRWRRKFLQAYVLPELKKSLWATVKKYPVLWIEKVNTDHDHVHLMLELPPSVAVSDAVSKLKSESSRHLRKKFKFIREIYIEKDGIWSTGYFSSTVGLNEAQIRKYIDWQGKKDVPRSLKLF